MKYLFFVLFSLATALLNAQTAEQASDFNAQLQQAVARAEDTVRRLQERTTDPSYAPTWNTKLELQNAVIQLEVKKTLVNNFKGSEVLRSSSVRRKLLDTLNKPIITTADLADLQSLVLNEKARLQAEQTQPQQ